MSNRILYNTPRWSIVGGLLVAGFAICLKNFLAVPRFELADGRTLGGPSLTAVILIGLLFMTFCGIWGYILEGVLKSRFKANTDKK